MSGFLRLEISSLGVVVPIFVDGLEFVHTFLRRPRATHSGSQRDRVSTEMPDL